MALLQRIQLQLNMNISHRALTAIRSKGFKAKPYRDSNGNLIVGYGHKVVPGDGVAAKDIINTFKASELLERDVKQIVSSIPVTNNITQEEFDALVIAKYNNNGH
jgi:GH24 family phage-related lysozyme (muramidase)